MGTIQDYTSGKILEKISKALVVFDTQNGPLGESVIGSRLLGKLHEFEPLVLTLPEAVKHILGSVQSATAIRVCRSLNPDSPATESVFLDDLAEAMVREGKAEFCSKEKAVKTLEKYPQYPLVLSRVSGFYQEICRSYPRQCIYWLAEQRGLKCLHRNNEA